MPVSEWLSDSLARFSALMITQSLQLWPYWVSGVFLGAVAKQMIKGPRIRKFLVAAGPLAIPAGAFMGVISPLCLFGALPVLATFADAGLSIGAVWAFLVASPLMNPNLFIMTWGGLSPGIAMARLGVALGMGLAAGILVQLMYKYSNGSLVWLRPACLDLGEREDAVEVQTEAAAATDPDLGGRGSGDISPDPLPWHRKLIADFFDSLYFTGRYLLMGMAFAALVDILIPQLWVMKALGGASNGFAVLVATGLGVPLYMCGGGSIPLIKQWMYVDGLSMGGAMAFMITGPSTKVANFAALIPALGKKGFSFYLALNILGAIVIGYGVDLLRHVL